MREVGIRDTLESLLHFDPDVADREEIGAMMRQANQMRGWVNHVDVRFARRLRELNAEGRSESAAHALMDEGRRSGREAKATEERERICSEFPQLEDALATGAVSPDHLDVLSKLTKNLTDAERSDLHAVADDIVDSATTDWVSDFERKSRNTIDAIKNMNNPRDEAAELDRQRAAATVKRWTDQASGMKMTLLSLDPIRDAAFHAAVDAQLARLKQEPANANVPFAQLQVDAVLAAVSTGPASARIPEVVVHVDVESVCHGRHADTLCETINGTPLPVSTVQRLCCEAIIQAVIVRPDGTFDRLCAELRTANRQQRRALAAMYATCAHPNCSVGFDHCRIHHVVWWTKGGKTVIANLIPLCEHHHHQVHEGGWILTMTPDRCTTWVRPDGSTWWEGDSTNRCTPPSRAAPSTEPIKPAPHPVLC